MRSLALNLAKVCCAPFETVRITMELAVGERCGITVPTRLHIGGQISNGQACGGR